MANIQKRYDLSLTANLCPPLTAKLLKPTIPPTESTCVFAEATREDVDLAVKAARREILAQDVSH